MNIDKVREERSIPECYSSRAFCPRNISYGTRGGENTWEQSKFILQMKLLHMDGADVMSQPLC